MLRPDSYGGRDLYVSFLEDDGTFSEPKNLGKTLNTTGNEHCPFLAADGKTLYFASYGHQGYGSADIFVSQRLDDSWTKWSQPENLGPRFNGPGYDAFFALGPDGTAYYASTGTKDTAPKKLFRTPVGPPPVPDPAAVARRASPELFSV